MAKPGKKKSKDNQVSARQIKLQQIAAKKKKQEEMKIILKSLKENQTSKDVLQNLETTRELGQKRKLKDLKEGERKGSKAEEEEGDYLDEMISDEESDEEEIEEEEEKKEEEEEKPVNIFQMKVYENTKKVKTEEKSTQPSKKTLDQMEQESHARIFKEEREANLSVNPFKDIKKIVEVVDDGKDEENKGGENYLDIFDEELRQFNEIISSKYNQAIERSEAHQKSREKLPIFLREADIMEAINNNLITIISGETGSGKSTQVPQFLYERGYGNRDGPNPGQIAITQPRRLAAIALAKRVADEMGTELGDKVTYQVRHEAANLNDKNCVKFMTDGIMLREMTTDFLLTGYSVILIDEAHERKVNTDILIGLLSRVVNIRFKLTKEERARKGADYKGKYDYYPLRLIIMSATLRVKDFTENKFLFPKPVCTLNVEARQFPLTTFFSKVTKDDYFNEALKKCQKIHKKLPQGGILVFLTGEKEIRDFCRQLQEELKETRKPRSRLEIEGGEDGMEEEGDPTKRMTMLDLDVDLSDNEDEPIHTNQEEQGEGAVEAAKAALKTAQPVNLKPLIVPLYSKLPLHEQEKIFSSADEKTRLIVVSTNVAETSLTIPGMKYVIDTGKEKKKIYDDKLSISHYNIDWISQASADQRAGRAARVGPGYCYRLYSRPVFGNIFAEYREPEIMGMPLENILLQLKAIGIKDTMKFPFPTMPDFRHIKIAIKNLVQLKALELPKGAPKSTEDYEIADEMFAKNNSLDSGEDSTNITPLGRALSYIPMAPRFAKMILMGRKDDCLNYAMLITAGLSVEEIFQNDSQGVLSDDLLIGGDAGEDMVIKQSFAKKYEKFIVGSSDLFTMMNILGEFMKFLYQRVPTLDNTDKLEVAIKDFGMMYNLIPKNLKAIFLNLRQLISIFETLLENDEEKKAMTDSFKEYKNPLQLQQNKLQELVVAISTAKVARKVKRSNKSLKSDWIYEAIDHDIEVFIHPNSCLKASSPDLLVYDELVHTTKYYMRNVTKVSNLHWLVKYDETATSKVELINEPKPYYSRKKGEMVVYGTSTFGPKSWTLPSFEYHYEDEDDFKKYVWFARSLLDGQVILKFKDLKPLYSAPVESIKEYSVVPKALTIVNKLMNNKIDSHKKLLAKWKTMNKFLFEEITQWCKPENAQKIAKLWPTLIIE